MGGEIRFDPVAGSFALDQWRRLSGGSWAIIDCNDLWNGFFVAMMQAEAMAIEYLDLPKPAIAGAWYPNQERPLSGLTSAMIDYRAQSTHYPQSDPVAVYLWQQNNARWLGQAGAIRPPKRGIYRIPSAELHVPPGMPTIGEVRAKMADIPAARQTYVHMTGLYIAAAVVGVAAAAGTTIAYWLGKREDHLAQVEVEKIKTVAETDGLIKLYQASVRTGKPVPEALVKAMKKREPKNEGWRSWTTPLAAGAGATATIGAGWAMSKASKLWLPGSLHRTLRAPRAFSDKSRERRNLQRRTIVR